MRPVRTPESNVTLTLPGGTADNDLPATRAMLMDSSRGQTEKDASLGWVTVWQPDDAEARRLEAGGCVEINIWGKDHPPIAVGVTKAVVPERELIDRGHVDRALGLLYARLAAEGRMEALASGEDPDGELSRKIEPGEFVDLWIDCVNQTRNRDDGGAGDPSTNGQPS